jgi:hypothetical protein
VKRDKEFSSYPPEKVCPNTMISSIMCPYCSASFEKARVESFWDKHMLT